MFKAFMLKAFMFKAVMRCAHALLLATLTIPLQASDEPYAPGRGFTVIDSTHIHAMVPAGEAEALRPFVARADVIYVAMAKDAGYLIRKRLNILLTDDAETHNGYSTVTPFPLINIILAPATQDSTIFTGWGELERTFTHEVTHHMSNDRSYGFRHVLEEIFGRIVPDEPLSVLFAYLSTPAHQTMPTFWHEGCAQWAETVYAPQNQIWQGRGKDSLTHMVWRLAAASPEGMPQPPDWRITYQRWPYGTQTYVWGLAYLRYLDGAYRSRATIWQLINAQEHRWAFMFNGGPEDILGKSHEELIAEARAALMREQVMQLAKLRTQPVTATTRLTPVDARVAAPAWTKDGDLFAALAEESTGEPEYAVVHRKDGGLWARIQAWRHHSFATIDYTGYAAHGLGAARSLPDGTLVFSAVPNFDDGYARTRVHIVTPAGDDLGLDARRVLQPDVAHDHDGWLVTAMHLLPAAHQEIVVISVDAKGDHEVMKTYPTRDIPWSPEFRQVSAGPVRELSWVETDPQGSRLVLAPLDAPDQRTVLATVAGRIIHPAWTADGSRVFFCADHTGVCNAWCVDAAKPGVLLPVTNVIGGIIACVPSPDGKELALIDHDLHGPFLARIPNDPATWPASVPKIDLVFPAPVAARWVQATPLVPAGRGHGGNLKADLAEDRLFAEKSAGKSGGNRAGNGDGTGVGDTITGDGAVADDGGANGGPTFGLPDDKGDPAAETVHPYHGLEEIMPLYWTPTTLAVPEGGYGIIGVAGDTLGTHQLVGSVGTGYVDGRFIGFAGYTYSGWKIELGALAWQSELLYNRLVTDAYGDVWDYDEIVDTGEVRAGYGLSGSERRYQLYVGAGVAEHRPIRARAKLYAPYILTSLPPLYGQDRYVELTAAYSDSRFFPTSYTDEDGNILSATVRHSDFGGVKKGDSVTAIVQRVITVWPAQSHQIALGTMIGWSRGDHFLQGDYTIGGINAVTTLPRGYFTVQAAGDYELGGSAAYRFPPARFFAGWATSPLVLRQLVLETFYDAAKVSTDHLDGNGTWYRSLGEELHTDVEVWTVPLEPGIGIAHRFDGPKGQGVYFTLMFGW